MLAWLESQKQQAAGDANGSDAPFYQQVAEAHGVKHELVAGFFDALLEAAKKRPRKVGLEALLKHTRVRAARAVA
eukprot:974889-Pyramimonas_sp.AAC.1